MLTVLKTKTKHKKALAAADAIDTNLVTRLTGSPDDRTAIVATIRAVISAENLPRKTAAKLVRERGSIPADTLALIRADAGRVAGAQDSVDQVGKIPATVNSFLAANAALLDPLVQDRLAFVAGYRLPIARARQDAPQQWRTYYFVLAGGEVLLVPTILLLGGYWRPGRARRASREHTAALVAERAELADPAP